MDENLPTPPLTTTANSTISGVIQPANAYQLTMEATESNIDLVNNTSDITVVGSIQAIRKPTYSAFNLTYGASNTIIINGTTYTLNKTYDLRSVDSVQIFTYTQTIPHNADGTKTVAISWNFDDSSAGTWNPRGTISGNVVLENIPRQSSITLSPTSAVIPDETQNLLVLITRNVETYTHRVSVELADSTELAVAEDVETQTTFNIANFQDNILQYIPNAQSTTLTVRCKTYSDTTLIGETTSTIDFYVASAKTYPIFNNFTYRDKNATTSAITGNDQYLISGKSRLEATISSANKAVARYYATMSQYQFTIAGTTDTVAYTESDIVKELWTISLSAQETTNTIKSLVISAIDSRGINKQVSKDITVLPYLAPIITAEAERTNGYESNTTFRITAKFSTLTIGGVAKNIIPTTNAVKYRYKKTTDTSWSSYLYATYTINYEAGTLSVQDVVQTLDKDYDWNVEFNFEDVLDNTTYALVVEKGIPLAWFGTDGRFGFGQMPEQTIQSGETGVVEIKDRLFVNGVEITGGGGGGAVNDVKIDNTSIVSSGTANIPHASNTQSGVVKTTGAYGLDISSSAEIKGTVVSSTDYPAMWNDALVSKGTLENALATKTFGQVDDVKVDGTSVVTNKVANIDLSTKENIHWTGTKAQLDALPLTAGKTYETTDEEDTGSNIVYSITDSITLPAGKWAIWHSRSINQTNANAPAVVITEYSTTDILTSTWAVPAGNTQNVFTEQTNIGYTTLSAETTITYTNTTFTNATISTNRWLAIKEI